MAEEEQEKKEEETTEEEKKEAPIEEEKKGEVEVKPTDSASQEPEKDKTTSIEDAREISKITTNYFISQNTNLSYLNFRIHSIKRNIKPDFWKVTCSFDEKFGSKERVRYELHVNKEGTVGEINELAENGV